MLLSSDSETRTAHPDLEELLLLQSGELDPEQTAVLEVHLENCPPCRARVDKSENLYGRVARAGSREAPRGGHSSARRWGAGAATGLLVCAGIVAAVRFAGPARFEKTSAPAVVETVTPAPTAPSPAPTIAEESTGVPTPLATTINPLDRAEAHARLALHAADLDTATLVSVERTASGVRIWGVVAGDEVRQSLIRALSNQPLVEVAVRTEAEQQLDPRPLPWASFQGDAPPLAADRLQEVYPTNSPERQQLQNTLDRLTRELVGLAGARQGLIALAGKPGVDDAALRRTAADVNAGILQRTAAIAGTLQPLLGDPAGAGARLSPAAAERLYLLVHELVFLSRGGASLSLEETISEIRSLLGPA